MVGEMISWSTQDLVEIDGQVLVLVKWHVRPTFALTLYLYLSLSIYLALSLSLSLSLSLTHTHFICSFLFAIQPIGRRIVRLKTHTIWHHITHRLRRRDLLFCRLKSNSQAKKLHMFAPFWPFKSALKSHYKLPYCCIKKLQRQLRIP